MDLRTGILALIVTGAFAAMVAGCGSSPPTEPAGSPFPTPNGSATAGVPSSTPSGSTEVQDGNGGTQDVGAIPQRTQQAVRAVQTAEQAVPDGRAFDLEVEDHGGRQVWEIKVASGNDRPHEFYVSLDGTQIVRRSRHRLDGDVRKALKAQVTLSQALETAARRVPWSLSEAEIDTHSGRITWEVEFKKGEREREVVIDAMTGEIMRVKKDDH